MYPTPDAAKEAQYRRYFEYPATMQQMMAICRCHEPGQSPPFDPPPQLPQSGVHALYARVFPERLAALSVVTVSGRQCTSAPRQSGQTFSGNRTIHERQNM